MKVETISKIRPDRDFDVKKGRMAGLAGKIGGMAGSENPIVDPHIPSPGDGGPT